MNIAKDGIKQFTQVGYINKKLVWQDYLDAEKLENTLDEMEVPPTVLNIHSIIRESIRHYRKAIGVFHSGDSEGFTIEMSKATKDSMKAIKLFEEKTRQLTKD
jgi:hypothetical protein